MRATLTTNGLMLIPDGRLLAELAPGAARTTNQLAALSMLAQIPLLEQTRNLNMKLPETELAPLAEIMSLLPLIALCPYVASSDEGFWVAMEETHQRIEIAYREIMVRVARHVAARIEESQESTQKPAAETI